MKPASPHAVVEADIEKQIAGHLSHAQLTPGQRAALKSFRLEFCVNRNQKLATQESYLRYICFLGRHVKKEFQDMTKDDIIDYISSLQGKSESLKDWAKLAIKMFFRWQRTGAITRGNPYPDIVSWIRVTQPKTKKVRVEDCISADEYRLMLNACKNQRDRALVALLYDSGARISEICNIQLKDVHMEGEMPFVTFAQSKTTEGTGRPCYLISSIAEIAAWYKMHPDKDNSNAFLFCNIKLRTKLPFITPKMANQTLQRIGINAGIRKHIHPHLFRHSSATNDRRSGMNDQFMQIKYGWTENSRMAQRYAHITAEDVARFQMKQRGQAVKKDETPEFKECPRCHAQIPFAAKECENCLMPLDAKLRMEKALEPTKINQLMEQMAMMQAELVKLQKAAARGTIAKAKSRAGV